MERLKDFARATWVAEVELEFMKEAMDSGLVSWPQAIVKPNLHLGYCLLLIIVGKALVH